MLSWALVFLVVALIAALLGFTGVAGTASGIADPQRDGCGYGRPWRPGVLI